MVSIRSFEVVSMEKTITLATYEEIFAGRLAILLYNSVFVVMKPMIHIIYCS